MNVNEFNFVEKFNYLHYKHYNDLDNLDLSDYATQVDLNTLRSNFQDGCNTLVSKCTACGSTPANNSPSAISNSIQNIYTTRYNSGTANGYTNGYNAGTSNAANNIFLKNITYLGELSNFYSDAQSSFNGSKDYYISDYQDININSFKNKFYISRMYFYVDHTKSNYNNTSRCSKMFDSYYIRYAENYCTINSETQGSVISCNIAIDNNSTNKVTLTYRITEVQSWNNYPRKWGLILWCAEGDPTKINYNDAVV